jgi:glycosyltransferase involved in cell wall biosynthesis
MPPYTTKEMGEGVLQINLDQDKAPKCDLYVTQQRKEEGFFNNIKKWREEGSKVISDADDWYLGVPTYNPAFSKIIGFDYKYEASDYGIKCTRTKQPYSLAAMLKSFALSDALTVSTPFLAEGYARYNKNVYVLRNYLNWDMWKDITPAYEQKRERIRIGYMGDAKWHSKDLEVVRGLGEWLRENHPNVDFVSAGGELTHDILKIPEDQRITYPKIHFREMKLPEITATFDIGIVPLELNKFNEGKSHLKGMEYAACGIPTVVSPTESYRYWIDDEIGFTVKKNRNFYQYLDLLINDTELRIKMGKAARKKAREHSIDKHVKEWEEVYTSV